MLLISLPKATAARSAWPFWTRMSVHHVLPANSSRSAFSFSLSSTASGANRQNPSKHMTWYISAASTEVLGMFAQARRTPDLFHPLRVR